MKKLTTMLLVLAMLFTSAAIAHAAGPTQSNDIELYEEYRLIIQEANDTYGYELSLLPFDEITDFCSPEEFQEKVDNYCQLRADSFIDVPQEASASPGVRGVGVVTVPSVKKKVYDADTITITFYGTFEIRQRLSGTYYAYSSSFTVYTKSANGVISFEKYGNPSTSLADGGRTTYVTQQFRAIVEGLFDDYVSVSTAYYVSPATGNVSVLNI